MRQITLIQSSVWIAPLRFSKAIASMCLHHLKSLFLFPSVPLSPLWKELIPRCPTSLFARLLPCHATENIYFLPVSSDLKTTRDYFSQYCTFQSAETAHCFSETNLQASQAPSQQKVSGLGLQLKFTSVGLCWLIKAKEMVWMLVNDLSKSRLGKNIHSDSPHKHTHSCPSPMGLAATELGFLLLGDKALWAVIVSFSICLWTCFPSDC